MIIAILGRPMRTAAQTPDKLGPKTLRIGIVSESNQRELETRFRGFARYLAHRLKVGPEIEGEIVFAPTTFELAKLFEQKQVELYMESPYPTFVINELHQVGKLLLRRWKYGMAQYHGLVFTKRDAGINRVNDLQGKLIAFEDRESTSGFYLPKFFLQRHGLKLADKSRFDPYGSATEVGYIFAHSQDNLLDWVLTRKVAAAAFSNSDYESLNAKQKSEITILAKTEEVPRHFLSVRRDLPAAWVAQLKQILIPMHNDPEGRMILLKADNTTKFDELPGGVENMRKRLTEIFLEGG